jgi:hypothetical protein
MAVLAVNVQENQAQNPGGGSIQQAGSRLPVISSLDHVTGATLRTLPIQQQAHPPAAKKPKTVDKQMKLTSFIPQRHTQ